MKRRTRISACCWRSWGGMQMARTELEAAAAIPPERSGNEDGAGAGVRGDWERRRLAARVDEGIDGQCKARIRGQDIYASALDDGIDPAQTENDAQQVL